MQDSSWDPVCYNIFDGERLRPAGELLFRLEAALPPETFPAKIIDLGCGPGPVTARLAQHWPEAKVTGVDSSPDMLAQARRNHPALQWRQADVADWEPEAPVNLLFSNACLQWLPDHARLFPRLLSHLTPGGVLAVQMPRNYDRPAHRLTEDAARTAGCYERLAPLFGPPPVAPPGFYYDLLSPLCTRLDIWETDYLHVLEGDNPVVDWVRGSWLRPFLAALEGEEQRRFEQTYAALVHRAFPPHADGRTLFPFRRLFIVAKV